MVPQRHRCCAFNGKWILISDCTVGVARQLAAVQYDHDRNPQIVVSGLGSLCMWNYNYVCKRIYDAREYPSAG